uniref:RNA polymerase n=1 Tax=Armillaria gallica TaxID=47427 RepID=A0A4D6FF56_ARMGA|nr:RNA polymerase [Armillaria gallica]
MCHNFRWSVILIRLWLALSNPFKFSPLYTAERSTATAQRHLFLLKKRWRTALAGGGFSTFRVFLILPFNIKGVGGTSLNCTIWRIPIGRCRLLGLKLRYTWDSKNYNRLCLFENLAAFQLPSWL